MQAAPAVYFGPVTEALRRNQRTLLSPESKVMIFAHITCQSAMDTSAEFPFFRRLGYHSEGPWVFLVRAGKGTRMSFLHGTFPPQPCSDLGPHATALPCLPACPPSGLAGRTRHRCPPSQTEKHVCPVPKAITFQTDAPWEYLLLPK